MTTIHKFPLTNPLPYSKFKMSLMLPLGFKVLSVGTQNDQGMLWVALDPVAAKYQEIFLIMGTGAEHDLRNQEFVGTYFVGSYVWHVFRELTGEY